MCLWATVLTCWLVSHGYAISQAAALDGPRLSSESGPVLAEIGGWQIFARRVSAHGAYLRFDEVQASRGPGGRWTLVADSLLVGLRGPALAEVDWWVAKGRVRLSGPDDLYVMAPQLVALAPTRTLVLMGDEEPAALAGADWQLMAVQIEVDLRSARVDLKDLSGPLSEQVQDDGPIRTDRVRTGQ